MTARFWSSLSIFSRPSFRRNRRTYLLAFLTFFILQKISLYHNSSKSPPINLESANDESGEEYSFIEVDHKNSSSKRVGLKHVQKHFTGFQKLTDSFYIFSTFLDLRSGNMGPAKQIRMLAVAKQTPDDKTFHCKFNAGDGTTKWTNVTIYLMAENHGMPWKAYYFSCLLPIQINYKIPFSFAMVHDESKSELSLEPVKTLSEDEGEVNGSVELEYSVCVPVLFGRAYSQLNLIEYFSYYAHIGIDHIFMYADSSAISSELNQVLDHYSKTGFLTVFPWKFPGHDSQLWYHGQLVAIQDCLNRNVGLSRYVIFQDLDEFIVPKKDPASISHSLLDSWSKSKNIAGHKAVSYYFTKKTSAVSKSSVRIFETKTKSKHGERRFTKCVVRPERIFEQGIHHVSRVIQHHYQVPILSEDNAVLHHYKRLSRGGEITDAFMSDHYAADLTATITKMANYFSTIKK